MFMFNISWIIMYICVNFNLISQETVTMISYEFVLPDKTMNITDNN